MLGYHGLSARLSSHRQSGENGSEQRRGLAHRAGQMRHRGIDGDDEIKQRNNSSGIGEAGELLAKVKYAVIAQDRRVLLFHVSLNADEVDVGK